MNTRLLLVGLLSITTVLAAVSFTGNATRDFANSPTARFYNRTYSANGNSNGFQFSGVWIEYDRKTDVMSFAVECGPFVCGDADNDGNPNTATGGRGNDIANWGDGEYVDLTLWTGVPAITAGGFNLSDGPVYDSVNDQYRYYPRFMVGKPYTAIAGIVTTPDLSSFGLYNLRTDNCPRPNEANPVLLGFGASGCWQTRTDAPFDSNSLSTKLVSSNGYNFVVTLGLNGQTNVTSPHMEWSISNFSHLPGNTGNWSWQALSFSWFGNIGSTPDLDYPEDWFNDGIGPDPVEGPTPQKFVQIYSLPCVTDACGVCGGDNSTCSDCAGVPFGSSRYDRCGVCNGNNSCVDCANVTNGNNRYDRCGVCAGNNACVDCANVTNGNAHYDRCGVCNGNNACVDCANVTNGNNRYDRCGVCAGNNACVDCANITNGNTKYDRCGVCNGNNACVDCANVTNGNSHYDRCGVCNGNNACVDCANVTNGNAHYDRCGVCNGNNACVDCANMTNGNAKYDRCGVCNGNNDCVDCANVTNGNAQYDRCGVCNGNNLCVDCANMTNGNTKYDECGVCGGDNTSCADCAGVPHGTSTYDDCGVCNGNNSCVDCAGVPFGTSTYDRCGICDGNNDCVDCANVTNGNNKYDMCGICAGDNSTCRDCNGDFFGLAKYDICGVCDGDNSTCTCTDYLGCGLEEVDYALLRWTVLANMIKINDTLEKLYCIKNELPFYDYQTCLLDLAGYIDVLHAFCMECLDDFDFAQVWFADFLAGNCVGVDCQNIDLTSYQESWLGGPINTTTYIRQRFYGIEQAFKGMNYRSFVDKYFGQPTPLVIGIQMDRAGLQNILTRDINSPITLPPINLPTGSGTTTPFQSTTLFWDPNNDNVHDEYPVPHFDFAFNFLSASDLSDLIPVGVCNMSNTITALTTCFAAAASTESFNTSQYLPAGYTAEQFPTYWLGDTWRNADIVSQSNFTQSISFASFNGGVSSYVPQVSFDQLSSLPNKCWSIPTIPAVKVSGYYPSLFCVRQQLDKSAVTIENFTWRNAA